MLIRFSSFWGVDYLFGIIGLLSDKSSKYIVKPALVLNRSGEWQYSYNPRIGMLLREIKFGTIYDRNGILLATSELANKNRQSAQ